MAGKPKDHKIRIKTVEFRIAKARIEFKLLVKAIVDITQKQSLPSIGLRLAHRSALNINAAITPLPQTAGWPWLDIIHKIDY